MHLVHTFNTEGQPAPVELHQRENGKFRVTYGTEVHDNLSYIRAAEEFGYSVFHALACAGKIEVESDDE